MFKKQKNKLWSNRSGLIEKKTCQITALQIVMQLFGITNNCNLQLFVKLNNNSEILFFEKTLFARRFEDTT